ncbi:MAG: hypothetical protein AMS16_01565 [Planctomycetes bacterium DG_58]|nr:MAG: hypothetical protein AMS16_01565 [Planctomycetes bacterium DG_58]KPL04851.1 MAG: hypothetical protein AMK75_00315 [Planctomycetes bacterium SM23_65]
MPSVPQTIAGFVFQVTQLSGEKIRRRLRDGSIRVHYYYRCGNNSACADHPRIRWRQEEIEQAVEADLQQLVMPDWVAEWFRGALATALEDVSGRFRQQKKMLTERPTELRGMLDRLLNAYLAGIVDEETFQSKSAELKRDEQKVTESLDRLLQDQRAPFESALQLFDFSQRAAGLWRQSAVGHRRELLECISLNRTLNDTTLVTEKRRPFDVLAERPFLKDGRGNWREFEPKALTTYTSLFFTPPQPHVLAVSSLMRASA